MNIGDMGSSQSTSNSQVEGNGYQSGSSTQINGVEQNGGAAQPFGSEMEGLAQDYKMGDSLQSGNAAQDIISKIMEQAKQEMQGPANGGGAEGGGGAQGGGGTQAPGGTSGGESAGGEASSLEDLIKKLIEQFSQQFNLNGEQAGGLNGLGKTAAETGMTAPAQA
jgi:hypothetical protein